MTLSIVVGFHPTGQPTNNTHPAEPKLQHDVNNQTLATTTVTLRTLRNLLWFAVQKLEDDQHKL